jgi:F-type H+/Na+-transporting ATPase subunit alpha
MPKRPAAQRPFKVRDMVTNVTKIENRLNHTFETINRVVDQHKPRLDIREVGVITSIGNGIVRLTGLPTLRAEELVRFPGDRYGMVFDLNRQVTGVIMLDDSDDLSAGDEVRRTGRVMDVPVGDALIGRVIDAKGIPMDGRGPIHIAQREQIEKPAPAIMDRAPITAPLQTGLKVIDALIPIGRGQRELILGDRQTGKSAIAIDTIINQKNQDVICIYCAIGKRGSAVAKVISELHRHKAMSYTIVMVSTEENPPGLQFIAPYSATTMGEYFMSQGRDVLIIYDDLTRHARAYREISLLLRRPPGREAYPGDIFYIHSRLLERSTHLKENLGGGSLTALPIIETEAQNISAYIPTNLISITDGQVYLSPELFQKGNLPAVDVGKSVSRVGGKTQLPAYRRVAGDLRLSYSQFEELESFSRFGTRMDEETRKTLERGRRVREILKQPQYEPIPAAEQIITLITVNQGLLDDYETESISDAETKVRNAIVERQPDLVDRIQRGEKLTDAHIDQLLKLAEEALKPLS